MHNTKEQNEAFRKQWEITNARWKAAIEQDKKKLLENTKPKEKDKQ